MNRITKYLPACSGDVPLETPESHSTPRKADPRNHRVSRRNDPHEPRGWFWGVWDVLLNAGVVTVLTCGFLAGWWILFFIAGHAIKTAWGV